MAGCENSPLLPGSETPRKGLPREYTALPIAFLASSAISATASSTIFAYGSILCDGRPDCDALRGSRYASTVAVAATIANVCGLAALGPYERLARLGPKLVLGTWLAFRASSVLLLLLGVLNANMHLALFARVFEGLAADNLLHFALNALYARSEARDHVSRLMGSSLALYMLGLSLSPALVGLFADFMATFRIALCLFAAAFIYLGLAPLRRAASAAPEAPGEQHHHSQGLTALLILVRPLLYFTSNPRILPHGLGMFLYNASTSYFFPALLVFTSDRFDYGSQQNSLIISVATGTSALYLFATLFAVPRARAVISAMRGAKGEAPPLEEPQTDKRRTVTSDFFFAVLALVVLASAMCGLSVIASPQPLYPLVALASFGLAFPSFAKAHLLSRLPGDSMAVAALSLAECSGSLVSPLILGGWQSSHPGGGVFRLAAALVAASILSLMTSLYTM